MSYVASLDFVPNQSRHLINAVPTRAVAWTRPWLTQGEQRRTAQRCRVKLGSSGAHQTRRIPPPLCQSNTKAQNFTKTIPAVALTRSFMKGKARHASKSCGNSTCCCSDKGRCSRKGERMSSLSRKALQTTALCTDGILHPAPPPPPRPPCQCTNTPHVATTSCLGALGLGHKQACAEGVGGGGDLYSEPLHCALLYRKLRPPGPRRRGYSGL